MGSGGGGGGVLGGEGSQRTYLLERNYEATLELQRRGVEFQTKEWMFSGTTHLDNPEYDLLCLSTRTVPFSNTHKKISLKKSADDIAMTILF